MKKVLGIFSGIVFISSVFVLTGCSKQDKFSNINPVTVVSREDGSGTRGAFVELFGVEEKDSNGNKNDNTTVEASITNNTSVMMTTVQSDIYAIGYTSLGALNDSVRALKIDGVEPTAKNIKNDTYKLSRPFNVVISKETTKEAQDFIDFILSSDGQAIVSNSGYVPVESENEYEKKDLSGKVVIAGSSSVSPVMEKLKEEYEKINQGVKIEIQTSDSTTGITSVKEGICNIGMTSRDLTDNESLSGIKSLKIAMDGIVVIVNKDNDYENLSSEDVKKIYIGDALHWADF